MGRLSAFQVSVAGVLVSWLPLATLPGPQRRGTGHPQLGKIPVRPTLNLGVFIHLGGTKTHEDTTKGVPFQNINDSLCGRRHWRSALGHGTGHSTLASNPDLMVPRYPGTRSCPDQSHGRIAASGVRSELT